jgi:hypothetical protein
MLEARAALASVLELSWPQHVVMTQRFAGIRDESVEREFHRAVSDGWP